MDPKKHSGLWLLPTHGRATTNLPRFFAAAKKSGMSTPGVVLVDEADYAINHEEYDALDLPENWMVHGVKGGSCAAATEQGLHELCDGLDWIGWLSDDLHPVTPGWDVTCIEALTGFNVVSTDDGKTAPRTMNGATVWSGDLIRATTWLYPPGLRHFYVDTAWELIGKQMNVWTVLMSVLVRHDHESWTPNRTDATTAHTQKAWATDEAAFINFKNKEFLPACNRVGELLLQYGVSQPLPNLSNISVLITTPCGDGKYERLFTSSLFGTIEILRQCGATVNFMELPYCSDISLARNKLFGMFLRSAATHMLFIDSDMAWAPQDVVRLFSYKRDFVAVAGPRKVFPPSFAVRNADARGGPAPLRQESGTGLFEVSHVGMAFSLLSQNFAQRMANAHPELEFSGDDGRAEYAIFNPMVVNKRYFSEDFAACERWRRIGGKIYIDAGISLQHVGAFVWSGAWMDHLITTANEQARAA